MLKELRKEVDKLDKKIIELFSDRLDLMAKISEEKNSKHLPIQDFDRENEIRQNVYSLSDPLKSTYNEKLFEAIFEISREYESHMIRDKIKTSVFGLVGGKSNNTLAPFVHSLFGDYKLNVFKLSEEQFKHMAAEKTFDGLCVASPYKTLAIDYCDVISEIARKTACLNVMVKKSDGKMYGYNTDYEGILMSLKALGVTSSVRKALILGSGEIARTTVEALRSIGIKRTAVVSRNDNKSNYETISEYSDSELIINTTPVGSYPENAQRIIDFDMFPACKFALDFIYNPLKTAFLIDAEKRGIACMNGVLLLAAKARRTTELFLDKNIDEDAVPIAAEKISIKMSNFILIGKKSVNKSEIGQQASFLTKLRHFDTNRIIFNNSGMTHDEITSLYGIDDFRRREEVAAELCGKLNGALITTSSGIVLNTKSMDSLRQNGFFIYLRDGDDGDEVYAKHADYTLDVACREEDTARLLADFISEAIKS